MEGSRVKTVAPFVEITPDAQLDFDLPTDGSKDSTCKLSLKNISSQPLLFKIKTTAPKEYCVRPNSGFIPAGESADVQVILQGPLPRPARKKDKFLVQTALLDNAPTAQDDLNQLLKDVSPDLMQEVKLRCQWNFGDDESAAAAPAAATTAPAPAAAAATPVTASATVPEPKKEAPAAPKVAPAPATDESGPVPTPRRNKATAAAAAASATPAGPSSSSSATTTSSSAAATAAAAGASVDSASRAVKKSVSPSAVAKPSSSSGAALAVADNENKLPSMILLIVAFILGVILGKFVW